MYTQLFPILTNEVIIGAGGMADATDDGDRNQRMGCPRRDPNSHYARPDTGAIFTSAQDCSFLN